MKPFSNTIKLTTILLASVSMAQIASAGQHPSYEPSLVPSGATAGECYARVKIPARYSTTQENVMVEEGYSKVEVEQPRLASRQEQVLVKEPSVRFEVRQPRYETRNEKMLVRPAYDKLSVSPPQFRTVTETVQTSAPRTVWKRGNPGKLAAEGYTVLSVANAGVGGRGYSSTAQYGAQGSAAQCGDMCEIWCLVEEPGETMTFNRKVMTSAGDVRRTTVPAKYTHISKQVVADPGGVREIPVPAEYRSVTVEDVVHPGGERRVDVPPTFGSVPKKTLIEGERYEWRRAVCSPGTLHSGSSSGYSPRRHSSGHSAGGSTGSTLTYGSSSGSGGYTSGSSHGSSGYTYSSSGSHALQNYEGSGRACSGSTCGSASQSGGTYYYGTDKPVKHHRHKSYR